MTVEALTDTQGQQANTLLEKEEMLRRESFPPNDDDQYYHPPPARSAHTRVTEHAVERALFSPSVKKEPGPDKLSFGATLLLWNSDKERIVRLTKAAIRTGRHPPVGMTASGVASCKSGKDDYTDISKMYFSHWKSPGVSERMWSVNLDESISGEYQTVGGHSGRPSE